MTMTLEEALAVKSAFGLMSVLQLQPAENQALAEANALIATSANAVVGRYSATMKAR